MWLLFPAGVGVMLLDGFWRKFLGVAFLFALPPGIETIQDYYPELKRSCSSQDVADNWTGLAIGLILGAVLAIIIGIVRFVRNKSRARRERRNAALRGPVVPAGEADMPLGGGEPDAVRYDDFNDFDDRPNSSRWHERDHTPTQPFDLGPDDRTLAMTTEHGHHLDPNRTRPVETSDPADPDATQIIRRR